MAPSPSSEAERLQLSLSGILRSSHALIFALAVICLLLFVSARDDYPVVAYGAAALIGVAILAVVLRFAVKGPELDRAQPSLTYSHNQLQIVNVDPQAVASLARFAMENRHPLPPPAGIITGSAADMSSIRLLSPEEAQAIQDADETKAPSDQLPARSEEEVSRE